MNSSQSSEDANKLRNMVAETELTTNAPRWTNAELMRVSRVYELMIKIDQRNKRKLAVKSDEKERIIKG